MELKESVLRGGKRCVFEIRILEKAVLNSNMNPSQPPSASRPPPLSTPGTPTLRSLDARMVRVTAIFLSFFVFTQFGVVPGYRGAIHACFDENEPSKP